MYKLQRMVKLIIINMLIIISIFTMTSCKDKENGVNITTDETEYYLCSGEKEKLNAMPDSEKYCYKSDNENVVKVDDSGNMTATGCGNATVTISSAKSSKSIKVNVFDKIVSEEFDETTNMYGTGRFRTVNDAVNKASDNDQIMIRRGKYGESVRIDKDITLRGEKGAVLNSIEVGDGRSVVIHSIEFYNKEYPEAQSATIKCGEDVSIEVINSSMFVDKKMDKKEDRFGGYAIYVGKNSHFVRFEKNQISNYMYGIYVANTGAEIDISDNVLTSLNKGIGINIEVEGSTMPVNYNATGYIKNNDYNDVEKNVEFFFAGEKYIGELIVEEE